MSVASGWYADPFRRHEYRYWDGDTWTKQVSDRGVTGDDAVGYAPPAPAGQPAVPVGATAAQAAPAAIAAPAAAAGTREIVVPEGRLFYTGQILLVLGVLGYVLIATVGWIASFGSSTSEPIVYLGSRSTALGTEYWLPGLLLVVMPWLVMFFQPRMERTLKRRAARESVNAQLRLPFSWRFTMSYKAKSYTWRRVVSIVLAGIALLVAVGSVVGISSDGYELSGAAYALVLAGALILVGVLIQALTPYRRAQVDSAGTVVLTG